MHVLLAGGVLENAGLEVIPPTQPNLSHSGSFLEKNLLHPHYRHCGLDLTVGQRWLRWQLRVSVTSTVSGSDNLQSP